VKALILGGGAREHAIAWVLSRSKVFDEIHAAPGNGGIAEVAHLHEINPTKGEDVVALAKKISADLTVVGPEAPLMTGVPDALRCEGIPVFGPGIDGARLEGSKAFAKSFMLDVGIPTPSFHICRTVAEAKEALSLRHPPFVVKADGLAAGKGAFVVEELAEAMRLCHSLLEEGMLGEAGRTVIIEDYIAGRELTAMLLIDGKNTGLLPLSQDHKRALDGDKGPNTGGMGAYAPVPWASKALVGRIEEISSTTACALKAKNIDYRGVIYIGLMVDRDERPWVLEYNARFGDPEAQVVLPICDVDWGEVMLSVAKSEPLSAIRAKDCAVGVVMASGGYPGHYDVGFEISGLEEARKTEGVLIFHAGTKRDGEKLVTSGGRVLTVVGLDPSLEEARAKAYRGASAIGFEGAHYRRDIAWQALSPKTPRKGGDAR